jgi:hypothetical protein
MRVPQESLRISGLLFYRVRILTLFLREFRGNFHHQKILRFLVDKCKSGLDGSENDAANSVLTLAAYSIFHLG